MKFLNSFLFVAFFLFAICAVLSFAEPNGNSNKVQIVNRPIPPKPIELKFFEHNAGDNYIVDRPTPPSGMFQYRYHDKWQSTVRILLKKELLNSQDVDKNDTTSDVNDQRRGDDQHRIRYVFGQRHEHDALVVRSDKHGLPSLSSPSLLWNCGNTNSGRSSLEITAIELNVTQTSPLGKAYLIPHSYRNQFDLYVERVNGARLKYDLNVYGFCVSQSSINNDDYYY